MSVKIYVEGGGDSKELRARCREGFRKLLEKAGFQNRMPRIVACGARNAAYDDFCTAFKAAREDAYPVLLIDSEALVTEDAWEHLMSRDGWERPEGAEGEQAQLMVTCMETWVMADRTALKTVFNKCLWVKALLPEQGLESRTKEDVQKALEAATHDCGPQRAYSKGRRSFRALSQLDPETLKARLPHFNRLLDTLNRLFSGPGT